MKLGCVLLVLILSPLIVASLTDNETDSDTNGDNDESTWKVTYDLLLECSQKPSMVVCLKIKAVKYLDRALSSREPIQLMDYINFAHDSTSKEEPLEMAPEDVESSLPRSLDDQNGWLDKLMQEKIADFFGTRTLQLTIPMDFEGRGKKGKYGSALLIGLGMAGMIGQLIMGKIALIAGKALIIAKVALVLSAIVGLKKLFGKGGESDTAVVYTGGGDGGWGHRSLSGDAHDIVYNAHAPSENRDSR